MDRKCLTKIPTKCLVVSLSPSLSIHPVAGAADEWHREAPSLLLGALSLCGGHVRDLVVVRAHRTGHGGGEAGPHQLAVLDETGRGDGGIDRRHCLYVHPVQGVSQLVHAVEGQKQVGKYTATSLSEPSLMGTTKSSNKI